ncbi:MAG: tetratricopeptide repeat protein [Deltaproteobacteria bacterium]|nr:tetratricopeptide repeat protein [Deltaproteobacteria bacterium]
MRCLPLILCWLATACGAAATKSTHPTTGPAPAVPRDDLARAVPDPGAPTGKIAVKDPRHVIDLDIIRIRAGESAVTASKELFDKATAQYQAKNTIDAMARFRQLVREFPDSIYAPSSLFNVAAILDGQGDYKGTVAALLELVQQYPESRESVEGHLYIAALQAEHKEWSDAAATLSDVLGRKNLTYADRIEANARRGYVEIELKHYDLADTFLDDAVASWRAAARIEDPYYIAMAHYYRGETMHRRFAEAPVRLPDDQLITDLEHKRALAVKAYDRWVESLHFKHAYWATAAGYQMSQIFVELWEDHVKAPYPTKLAPAGRPTYVKEVHDRVREHLTKALDGHKMNVELAKAYGVDTEWSKSSVERAAAIEQMIAADVPASWVTPGSPAP